MTLEEVANQFNISKASAHQILHENIGMSKVSATQLAFFINLQRAVIGPSATLTGRYRPAIDL